MKFYGDYHTHSTFSDGTGSIRENAEVAVKAGLAELAITDHGISNVWRGNTWKKINMAREEISLLNQEYKEKNLNILLGIEANITSIDGSIDIPLDKCGEFDLVLCGYHRGALLKKLSDYFLYHYNAFISYAFRPSKRVVERNTKTMINAIKKYPIAILTHINNYSIVDCKEVAKACSDYGTFIEINCKHVFRKRFEMSDFIEDILSTDVTLIASTDAHKADNVGNFSNVVKFLEPYGSYLHRVVNLNDNKPIFRK